MKLGRERGIALAVITASLGLVAFQATRGGMSVTFHTPEEVYRDPAAFAGRTFRVSGLVLGGTRSWDARARLLTFRMTDLQDHEFLVSYRGMPPDLFKEGQGVIVEGALTGDLTSPYPLQASQLMVKHSEVYDTQRDHTNLREARLASSLFPGRAL